MKILILIATLLLISACSTDKLEVVDQKIERTKLNLPDPEPVVMDDVKFIIVTRENAEQVFSDLESQGVSPVLIGLTDEGYEVLSLNFAKVRKYIIANRNVLKKYREYYEGPEDVKSK